MISVNRICPITSKYNTMQLPITAAEYNRALNNWNAGALIQVAFPMLNADQREFIKTGIMPDTWHSVFAEGN